MGQLRTALHAYALDGNGPARTLELVDGFAQSMDEDAMATAAYATVDLKAATVRFASAGHLPPVVLSGNGDVRPIEVASAPPIGAFRYRPCPEHEIRLVAGQTLFFYTDGLIERPGVPLHQSIELLSLTLRGATAAEEACLIAMDQLIPNLGPRDDVAVIAVQIEPASRLLELERPARPTVLAGVRQTLQHWLWAQDLDHDVKTDITIAVNEACSNAIAHAYGPGRGTFMLRAVRADESIEVSVKDWGHWRSPRGQDHGRGLDIIRAAMDNVHITTGGEGTEIVMQRIVGHE
jgi:anti-sigma regulatory factor (Ser/Thr protein kinase)